MTAEHTRWGTRYRSRPDEAFSCQERDPQKSEIFIVEGESAGGSGGRRRHDRDGERAQWMPDLAVALAWSVLAWRGLSGPLPPASATRRS
jgi:hypothetical protein